MEQQYYPCENSSDYAFIYMLGPDAHGPLVKAGVNYLHQFDCNVLALAFEMHEIELKQFQCAIDYLKEKNQTHIGIVGGSATAMLALVAASYYPQITMTIAFTPCDFVMEGYVRENRVEIPTGTSIIKGLDYLPYAYRHPQYMEELKREAKAGKNVVASKGMFEKSEQHLQESMMIRVENIQGTLVCVGAEDDCLWNTVHYIQRMKDRRPSTYAYTYTYGTHFLFPQSMMNGLVTLLFASGRKHYRQCKQNRIDVESKMKHHIQQWKYAVN